MSANVLERIDRQMEGLDPESVRYQILVSLRKFRSSWVELGRFLTDIAYGGDYKEWGHEDFEVYCARELGLKKPTVKKLMVSYNYMKSYAPERLEKPDEDGGYDVPDYPTIELLKKAREREDIAEGEKEELHRMAFDGVGDEGVLRKEIRSRMRLDAGDPEQNHKKDILGVQSLGRKLRQKIAASHVVPETMADEIDQAVIKLEELD